jgi:hypothetical protein
MKQLLLGILILFYIADAVEGLPFKHMYWASIILRR